MFGAHTLSSPSAPEEQTILPMSVHFALVCSSVENSSLGTVLFYQGADIPSGKDRASGCAAGFLPIERPGLEHLRHRRCCYLAGQPGERTWFSHRNFAVMQASAEK
jgi:hypothetical protein